MNNKVLAIIPARGGSKRIPHKNIKEFLGQPIIKYSIDAALQANCFNEIMVSTDSNEIAETAIRLGAKVPFLRSECNSSDFALTAEVIEEVLLWYQKKGLNFKFACCIYPTAPFVTAEKLRLGYNLMLNDDIDGVIPIVRFSYPIQRALRVEEGWLRMIHPENLNVRSQDLAPTYHDAGQFCWFRVESLLKYKTLFLPNIVPLELSENEVQDIDNEEDWKLAELKYKIRNKNKTP